MLCFFISVDGGFSDWTLEGNCSVTCGDGIQNRVRFCNNPTPAHGGRERQGPERDIVPCTLSTCLIKSVAMLTIERNITNPDRTVPTVAVDVNHEHGSCYNCMQPSPYTRYSNEEGDLVVFSINGRPFVCSPSCKIYNPEH